MHKKASATVATTSLNKRSMPARPSITHSRKYVIDVGIHRGRAAFPFDTAPNEECVISVRENQPNYIS